METQMKALLASVATAVVAFAATTVEAATTQRVTFMSGGEQIVGTLYLPDGHRAGQRLPTVIVTGAWTTVKEQMPARYAAEMAERGYAALTFDFRGWGESAGAMRQVEDPVSKTADIKAAAAFLATRAEIDPARIGALGICASAGYAVGAAAASDTIASVAVVAPWLHDRAIVNAVYGGAETVNGLIATGRAAVAQGGRMIPAASTTDSTALMFNFPYYTETDRGQIPAWVNQFNLASWEPWLTFDAQTIAPALTKPFAMVHSEAAAIPQGAKLFYQNLSGPKTQLWLDGVGQVDFYDRNGPVERASDFVARHFDTSL
jgi:uncharacterized protein